MQKKTETQTKCNDRGIHPKKKEQEKVTARNLSEAEISNMHDPEFKATIIRILTGLEKRNEDMSETLITE